uniref:Uncharacterized protein n=1 Tax=Avena sativa TaxID=4498 RepID=A0ACD5V321_AVESA
MMPKLVDLRDDWAVQSLVLFSFALQVFLLLFASIRRHSVSTLRRLLLWLAYLLADSTAVFTLGHLSISSKMPERHQLVAFWAPFLLVHLGGQDTITAYSFEDNRLWLRHLQTLVVQVLGTAYVIYKYIPVGETWELTAAAILIFVVGVVKYGERIWALRSATLENIWNSVDENTSTAASHEGLLLDVLTTRFPLEEKDAEAVLMGAHSLLDVCKGLFIGLRLRRERRNHVREALRIFKTCGLLNMLMEMELSLMYDILYTKAVVIHTWYGCCIRVVSLVGTAAALLLFQLNQQLFIQRLERKKNQHQHQQQQREVDVAITYVLLSGALLLEVASVTRAAASTWTRAWAYYRKWHAVHQEVLCLRTLVRASRHRKWSGYVGQYKLLDSCARDASWPWGWGWEQQAMDPVCVAAARRLGLGRSAEYWWDNLRHSSSGKLSDATMEMVLTEILENTTRGGNRAAAAADETTTATAGLLPGMLTLQRFKLDDRLGWSIQDIEFEDSLMDASPPRLQQLRSAGRRHGPVQLHDVPPRATTLHAARTNSTQPLRPVPRRAARGHARIAGRSASAETRLGSPQGFACSHQLLGSYQGLPRGSQACLSAPPQVNGHAGHLWPLGGDAVLCC